jgi:hypothetical protein
LASHTFDGFVRKRFFLFYQNVAKGLFLMPAVFPHDSGFNPKPLSVMQEEWLIALWLGTTLSKE